MQTSEKLSFRHLDLCSGIGGFALAARWMNWQTVQFVEIDKFCQAVLAKHWPGVPIHGDLRTFERKEFNETVDIVTGGYPCQPFSTAGQRRGESDHRHLWPEVFRIVCEFRPHWCVFENVAGHISMGLDTVLAQLEDANYTAQAVVIPACAVNAWHRRDRVWIIANTEHGRREGRDAIREGPRAALSLELCTPIITDTTSERCGSRRPEPTGQQGEYGLADDSKTAGNATGKGLPNWAGGKVGQPSPLTEFERSDGSEKEREIERDFRGMAYGVSRRVDRLRAPGNSIVPQIAYQIFQAIAAADEE